MSKREFRKVYFICENNQVFAEFQFVNCYRQERYAAGVCDAKQRIAEAESHKMHWPKGKPVPAFKVHGFYLIHESLFDEILKEHSK